MGNVRDTSLAAFRSLIPELNNREKALLEKLEKIQPASDRDLASALNWEINQVNGRRNSLVKKGKIQEAYKLKSYITNRTVIYWELVPEQTAMFKEYEDSFQVRIQITPLGKPRMLRSDRWKKRPAVLRYWTFCDEIRLQWGKHMLPPSVQMVFEIPMPPSWSAKKRASMLGTPHQQRPDIDNLQKSVLDALCEDDSYVYRVDATKVWGEQGSITIKEI